MDESSEREGGRVGGEERGEREGRKIHLADEESHICFEREARAGAVCSGPLSERSLCSPPQRRQQGHGVRAAICGDGGSALS